MLFSFSAVQRRKKFAHLPLGLRTRAQTHLCDRSPLAPPRAPRTARGYAAMAMAAPQNPSSGGATASFDLSMTRASCRSCSRFLGRQKSNSNEESHFAVRLPARFYRRPHATTPSWSVAFRHLVEYWPALDMPWTVRRHFVETFAVAPFGCVRRVSAWRL